MCDGRLIGTIRISKCNNATVTTHSQTASTYFVKGKKQKDAFLGCCVQTDMMEQLLQFPTNKVWNMDVRAGCLAPETLLI